MSGQLNYTEADALLSKPVNFHHFKWFYSVDFNIDPNEINLCIYITASKSLINVGKLRGIGWNYCFICLSSEIRTYLKDTFPFFFFTIITSLYDTKLCMLKSLFELCNVSHHAWELEIKNTTNVLIVFPCCLFLMCSHVTSSY